MGKGKHLTKIDSNIRFKSRGLWALLSTDYRISSIIKKFNEGKLANTRLRYGDYHYLVVAQSEKKTMYTRISKKEYNILNSYQDTISKDLLITGINEMDIPEALKFLKRMIKIGVFEIEE